MSALIRLSSIEKTYQMGSTSVRALRGVSIDIASGEFVSITGASGSGKSTMMGIVGCLDRPTGGEYWLDGKQVGGMNDQELARVRNESIGFVFQMFNLLPRTSAEENVSVPLFYARKGSRHKLAVKALEQVGLGGRARHKPNELSGGERQRVAIARAIVNEPLLILADEPTGNLDSRTGAQIMNIFHQLNADGVTIVLVTHEPEVARQARRIIELRDGKLLRDELVSEKDRLAALAERERLANLVIDDNDE